MLRTICTPETEQFTWSLPKEYVGQEVEFIAFVVDDTLDPQIINPFV